MDPGDARARLQLLVEIASARRRHAADYDVTVAQPRAPRRRDAEGLSHFADDLPGSHELFGDVAGRVRVDVRTAR